MKGYKANIEKETKKNGNFRKVLYTGPHSQLVLMTLQPKEEIGSEVHKANDQFFRIESGNGKCIIDGNVYKLKDGDAVLVPQGARHNIINTDSRKKLKIYTIYSPPHHKDGILRKTKKSAEEIKEHYDGKTTEKRKKTK
ncbi:MAG: cupin domain-containing protein [Saprospiraceae bacterium]